MSEHQYEIEIVVQLLTFFFYCYFLFLFKLCGVLHLVWKSSVSGNLVLVSAVCYKFCLAKSEFPHCFCSYIFPNSCSQPCVWRFRTLCYDPDPEQQSDLDLLMGQTTRHMDWHSNAGYFTRVILFAPVLAVVRCARSLKPFARKAVSVTSDCKVGALSKCWPANEATYLPCNRIGDTPLLSGRK